jgi:hypothetical protein
LAAKVGQEVRDAIKRIGDNKREKQKENNDKK